MKPPRHGYDPAVAGQILVTGGTGYIGSHTVVSLLEAGHDVVIVDDLSNSSERAVDAIAGITGRRPVFVRGDVCDPERLEAIFSAGPIDAVLHFAARKSVAESVRDPDGYERVNVGGLRTLVDTMRRHDVRRLVFSSSCTVYGEPDQVPVHEDAPLRAVNPYGATKLAGERLLGDVAAAEPGWSVVLLRYFNPIGAHPSGAIGEDPHGIPDNLVPYVMQVAAGRLAHLSVYGGDYPTRDGTCIRDYLHVVDLAEGHLAALDALDRLGPGCRPFNLGTGVGSTVLEVLAAAERAVGRQIPHRVVGRRPGDAVAVWADPTKAEAELGWRARRDLDAMCADHWRWQSSHPDGFAGRGDR